MKTFVKLAISILSVLAKIAKLRKIITLMTGNAYFPSPNPTMATCATAANQLEAAYLKAQDGTKADRAALRQKEAEVDLLFKQLATYIETVASANQASAQTIILSSGFELKGAPTRVTPEMSVELTGVPGEVKVRHKAVRGAAFEYQISFDLINWSTFEISTRSRFKKRDLTRNTLHHLRSRVINADGPAAWSEVVSVFVM